jgi:D-glycero-D-manno-heptose 1,7-bisphosphate phosphatase
MIKNKIRIRSELVKECRRLRTKGKTVGFTSGAFDLLHAGHVDYLEKAKAMCDVLIVGVNSDASVQKYKGEGRPVVGEEYRVQVVAALESVDYVFLFDERRNQKNIELLQPDFYIKAGDYTPESLTSKEITEKHGGEVRIIPILQAISTTEIIEKIHRGSIIQERWIEKEKTVHLNRKPLKKTQAVFLDRDGTICEEVGYLHDGGKFTFLPEALAGIKKFYTMGYRIIIITNQPGIGIGYFSEEDFYRVNRIMLSGFSREGILIDKIYYCPHSKSEGCSCRKPNQALVQRAKEELNLDLKRCYFIGDKTSDMETGKRAGIKTILVNTGFGGKDGEFQGKPDFLAGTLLDAAEWVLNSERESENT